MEHRFNTPLSPHSRIDLFDETTPDWLDYLRGHHDYFGDEFDLTQLEAGDRLLVVTQRTVYRLTLLSGRDARLETDRSDRPAGLVRIIGCSFGLSSSLKPDHLFCGGNLRFAFRGGCMVHTTTAIREIGWRRDGTSS